MKTQKIIISAALMGLLCLPSMTNTLNSTTTTLPDIQVSITNRTGNDSIISARYTVLPAPDPTLASMPNPFIFVEALAGEVTRTHFAQQGGGRLGCLEEIVIRTRDYQIFKTFDKTAINTALQHKEILMFTIGGVSSGGPATIPPEDTQPKN